MMKYSENQDLWRQLNATNIVPKMKSGGLFDPGRYIDIEDKKLHKFPAIDIESPWIYTNPNPDLYCMEYRAIFNGFGFIATPCLDCWKIVVQPNTFNQLMLLLELEEQIAQEHPKYWCKCGVEERPFVPRHYGGYFYTRSHDEGQERKQFVKQAVKEHISPKINVTLKRYCTEFELRLGPSNLYRQPEGAKELESEFWENVYIKSGAIKQPRYVREYVISKWMLFAWDRADATVMKYNNDQPLFEPSVIY